MSEPLEPNDAPPLEAGAAGPRPPSWKSETKPPFRPSPLPGILTGLTLGGVLVGAGILLAQTLHKNEGAPATPAPASPAPAPAPDPIAALTARVDDLSKQLASLPRPEPAPDLKPIEAKVDALSRRLDAAVPETRAVAEKAASAAREKADALARAVDVQKGEIAALIVQVKSLTEAKPIPVPAETAAPAPAANAAADAEFAKAVELFKKNQFAPARDAFVKLQESMPKDARVWYYSALSNGYATNVWNGDTGRMAMKGNELEKAGSPDAARINAAFADLPPAARDWLDAYRKR